MFDVISRPADQTNSNRDGISALAVFMENRDGDLMVAAKATAGDSANLSDGVHTNLRGDQFTVTGGNVTEFHYNAGESFTNIQRDAEGSVVSFTADLKNWKKLPQDSTSQFLPVRQGTGWTYEAENGSSPNSAVDLGHFSIDADGAHSDNKRIRRHFEIPKN